MRHEDSQVVDHIMAVRMLRERGLWDALDRQGCGLLKTLGPMLPTNGVAREAGMRLVNALDDLVGRVANDAVLLAVVCAGLRELSGWTLARMATLLAEASDHLFEVYTLSRLVQVGELVSSYPVLLDIRSFYRLLTLTKIPDELKPEVFEAGVISGCVDIRMASRDELIAAISILRGDAEDEVQDRKVRRDLGKARSAVAKALKVLKTLSGQGDYVALVESLRAADRMLGEALNTVAEVPLPLAANGTAHV